MSEEVGVYLQPISSESPAGQSIRYLPIWNELQDMRKQEDERLPKGAWQRAPIREISGSSKRFVPKYLLISRRIFRSLCGFSKLGLCAMVAKVCTRVCECWRV